MLTQTQNIKAFGMENKVYCALKLAANTSPLISSKQVLQHVVAKPNKSMFAKHIKLFIGFGVIGLVLFFTCKSYLSNTLLYTAKIAIIKQKTSVLPNKVIAKKQSKIPIKKVNKKMVLVYAKQTFDSTVLNNIDLPIVTGNTLQNNINQQQTFDEMTESYQAEELTLNYAELAELGIITDGNTLTYFAITDTFRQVEKGQDEITLGAESYKLYIEKYGSSRTDKGYCFDTIEAQKSKPFYAAAVELDNGLKTYVNTVNNMYGDGFEDKYIDSIKPHLIPIDVQLIAVKGLLSHDVTIRFWFKNTLAFLAALPPRIAEQLKVSYPDIKDETYFKEVVKYYNSIDKITSIYDYTPEFIKSIQQHYVALSTQGIKQLGIKIKPNNVKLKLVAVHYSEKSGKNSITKTRYINTGESTYIDMRNKKLITTKRAYKKMELAPIACSNNKVTQISFLRNYKNNIYVFSNKTNYQGFKKIAPDLIPILVDSQHVFWYEPNATINNIIKQYKK